MGLRFWIDDEFASDRARAQHSWRAREQWQWIAFCHFWLLGRGARERIRGEPYDSDERRAAERERLLHGWNIETVEKAYSAAKASMDPIGKIPCPPFYLQAPGNPLRGVKNPHWSPGPTVERDWPEPSPCTDEEAEAWKSRIRGLVGVAISKAPTPRQTTIVDDGPDSDRWSF